MLIYFNRKNIIGDIWLYNQASTPQEVNWNNQKEMPFLNSAEYVQKSKKIIPITDKEEVHVEWRLSDRDQKLIEVNIFLRDRLIAKMSPGSKPGWSNIVKKDGPLAKVLR